MSLLPTFLFGDDRIAGAVGGRGAYEHTFGGPHDRQGISREDCNGILIHLLHRLDLTDPAISIVIPGVRWLPLYYCFDFRANEIGYRLISEERLVAFLPSDDRNVTDHESWPDDDYPMQFPLSPIKIIPVNYDPTDLDDAYRWAGIFGIDKLSPFDQAQARQRVMDDPLNDYIPETDEEYDAALSSPFMQGKPRGRCLNPGCHYHAKESPLATIAWVQAEPVKGVHTFGRWGGGTSLIFQLCPLCHTIRVSNQAS